MHEIKYFINGNFKQVIKQLKTMQNNYSYDCSDIYLTIRLHVSDKDFKKLKKKGISNILRTGEGDV